MPLYRGRVKAYLDYTVTANNEVDACDLIVDMAVNEHDADLVEIESIEEVL